MALRSFNASCDRKFRKKINPHTQSQQLHLAGVAGGCTKATEHSQGVEGDLWATPLGQTFSLSGVFLGLQQLKHQKSLKTPNHHPSWLF